MTHFDINFTDTTDNNYYYKNCNNHITVLDIKDKICLFDIPHEYYPQKPKGLIDIQYGIFSILFSSMHPTEMTQKRIASALEKYKHCKMDEFLLHLYFAVHSCFTHALGVAEGIQKELFMELLVREIHLDIEQKSILGTLTPDYTPTILYDTTLQNMFLDVLKRNENDISKINDYATGLLHQESFIFSSTLDIKDNNTYITYIPTTIMEILIVDLMNYINKTNLSLKTCECCGRLFLPKRNNDKYCTVFWIKTHKPCNEYMKSHPSDRFSQLHQKARDNEHHKLSYYLEKGRINHTQFNTIYNEWNSECNRMKEYYKINNDPQGFENWINSNKLNKSIILEKAKKCL